MALAELREPRVLCERWLKIPKPALASQVLAKLPSFQQDAIFPLIPMDTRVLEMLAAATSARKTELLQRLTDLKLEHLFLFAPEDVKDLIYDIRLAGMAAGSGADAPQGPSASGSGIPPNPSIPNPSPTKTPQRPSKLRDDWNKVATPAKAVEVRPARSRSQSQSRSQSPRPDRERTRTPSPRPSSPNLDINATDGKQKTPRERKRPGRKTSRSLSRSRARSTRAASKSPSPSDKQDTPKNDRTTSNDAQERSESESDAAPATVKGNAPAATAEKPKPANAKTTAATNRMSSRKAESPEELSDAESEEEAWVPDKDPILTDEEVEALLPIEDEKQEAARDAAWKPTVAEPWPPFSWRLAIVNSKLVKEDVLRDRYGAWGFATLRQWAYRIRGEHLRKHNVRSRPHDLLL